MCIYIYIDIVLAIKNWALRIGVGRIDFARDLATAYGLVFSCYNSILSPSCPEDQLTSKHGLWMQALTIVKRILHQDKGSGFSLGMRCSKREA